MAGQGLDETVDFVGRQAIEGETVAGGTQQGAEVGPAAVHDAPAHDGGHAGVLVVLHRAGIFAV